MKTVSKLSLLSLTLILASCNEKVSPELQNANVSTPETSPTTPPTEYYFTIENSAPSIFGYRLHKTGAGNASATCEVRSTAELSSDIFRGNPTANDISCFYDAEELALFNSGFSFDVKASKNTCQYVSYMPFGYYNRIPGDSSASYYEIECSNAVSPADITSVDGLMADVNLLESSGGRPGCGSSLISESFIPAGTRVSFTKPSSDADYCRFDYKDSNPVNCDIGIINVETITITAPEGATPLSFSRSSRNINCGGKVVNCLKGPTTNISQTLTRIIQHNSTTTNQDFTKEYSFPALSGAPILYDYVNYRRNLANMNMDFIDSFGLGAAYKSVWSNASYGKIFNPGVMEYYSANLMMDGTTELVDSTRLADEAVKNNRWFAKPLATDPFMGISGYRVNPFYTFYCLDGAYDIKARIRLLVREWDRVIPTTTSDLELLSDLYKGSAARQDAPGYVELNDDLDIIINFNDVNDWDDFIPMERTSGSFSPVGTIWSPKATVSYPDGWFNPSYFPNISNSN